MERNALDTVGLALEEATIDGSPAMAAQLRDGLAARLYSPDATHQLSDYRLILRPAESEICGDGALRTDSFSDALRWNWAAVQGRPVLDNRLRLARAWLAVDAADRARAIVSSNQTEVSPRQEAAIQWLKEKLGPR